MIVRSVPVSTYFGLGVPSYHAYPALKSSFPRAPQGAQGRRSFSHFPYLRQAASNTSANHYDVLRLPMQATPAELKKQFYVLSKETHPDVNKSDPKASERFAQISESYSVLADPEKRKRYDRDIMKAHHPHHRGHSSHGHRSQGGTYAGHRPASGLSKRRSVFKGPPPSFYAHGNPSSQTQQRADARPQGQHAAGEQYTAGTFNAGAFSDGRPAFDARPTFKTQTHEDYRRANRRAAELAAAQASVEEDNFWARFIVVSGIIVLGVSVGTLILRMANTPRGGGLVRGDGSRRDGARNEWTKG
ncbi:DnaJ domain protein [Fonsecaea pedrosoi]|nr:DnaJ domain protein [Fonsecaea pedrosoi]